VLKLPLISVAWWCGGIFPAQLNGGDAAISVRAESHRIQGGDAVSGADFSSIFGIIV